jgi:muramoyltetrapeptide carboxypeptidase
MVDILIPPPLLPGDTIGIVAPSGQIQDRQRFVSGLQVLQKMGFQVRFPQSLWPGTGYLADTDAKRADEFNRMWADPEVRALMAVRGGYGCLRILDKIEPHQVRQTPKLFIGFSDITILHSFLQKKAGLVTLHGPVLTSLAGSSKQALERFHHCLLGNWRNEITWKKMEILRGGKQRQGILAGGNLSSIISLLGTPFAPRWKERIVFLEDTHEPLYRIDRMLTQLSYAGRFKDIAGLILGDFSIFDDQDPLQNIRHHETVWQRTLELTAQADIPVWGGFPAGHGKDNLTLPLGSQAVMDSDTGSLRFN